MLTLDAKKPSQDIRLGRVLVVEDEELIRETIALALNEEGYEVLTAEDGRMAMELTCQFRRTQDSDAEPVDLIILDLMLPSVNGLDLCRLIRHEGNSVPILMLSAKGSETDRVVGLEVGADDYLTKPFGMRELIARCRALLRRHRNNQPQPQSQVLSFQEITLYPQECRVTVRGHEISLSPKEYRILELFMSNPRRVWSREQLIERVWGPDFMGDSKTVDVHIRWLREKLELNPSNPEYLLTVRGFGYRFG
ncbi:MAG: response regulator transcription factor [Synechococcales cyanobacterium K44_A2020_017]|jgi:two-component system phosphate regulon response regulator PhoB|uniref:response regulator transcription factor n=1 Tax=Leptolyngbya sp. CCY15150 TaxID=2767772 RepID=UPI00194DB769|nr:response regulator transcription factor [Leptolyngbya sp. CCY15150]MBF2089870.1 response regulator transcription factor [Synechococcales cyanobacterium K32_A2020_035]MBF2096092.1 response regulator transcription factor [Synechococcales cyanobacterium K44_A2020_017]